MRVDERGLFCLEGEWEEDLADRTSIEPLLRLLEGIGECSDVIHRDVATRHEFVYYLNKWLAAEYAKYSVAYLSLHGSPGCLSLGVDQHITLDELAEAMDCRGEGRILYFGSCGTMAVDEHELRSFCRRTRIKGVVGYTKDLDWTESAAFDLIMLPELLRSSSLKPVYKRLRDDHPRFVHGLGLRMATAQWATDPSSRD